MSLRSSSPLTRYSSQDLTRPHQSHTTTQQSFASPSPLRSNSFVASRRSGVVSEQDALRLADTTPDDDGPTTGQQPCTRTTSAPSRWPAAVLRQMSGERRPRPLSTGYLPSNTVDSQSNQQPAVYGQGPQTVRGADGVDPQLRLQNVPLLPNRQLIQQPAESRWRQWTGSTPQRKGRPFGDVNPSTTTTDNGWARSTAAARSSNHVHDGPRPDEQQQQQQLLAEREAELRAMRSTMEQNEAAILRAMDDQRRASELEAAAERESWQLRLRDAQRQTDDVRQSLLDRVRDLERQNAALLGQSSDTTHSGTHRQRTANNDDQELRGQRAPGDEMFDVGSGSLEQLPPTINGVDGRPYTARNYTSNPSTGVGTTNVGPEQRGPPPTDGEDRRAASPEGRGAAATRRRHCQHCETLSGQLERVRRDFDAERQQWLAEKRRVIAYQKLLQSRYVELERRCAQLEGGGTTSFTDKLNHAETVNGGLAVHGGGWHSAQAQASSSSSSLMSPRLIPFGQSVET